MGQGVDVSIHHFIITGDIILELNDLVERA